jgi:Leucine-rich repeat (LRR) protein
MEFSNLNGLDIYECNLPTLKSGLFKEEFQKIEFLKLEWNRIENIEPEAFQYLIKLKWVRLYRNNLKTLPNRLFGNNPALEYIDLERNQINAIHPNFFDGLEKLVTKTELSSNLQKCFENCSIDSICSKNL